LEAQLALSPSIRHCRTSQLVVDTIPGCRPNNSRRQRHRQRGRRRPDVPRRRTGSPSPGSPGEPRLHSL